VLDSREMKDKVRWEKNESKKFSIERCKKTLNKNGNNYSDEEVKKIRDFLYFIAETEYENFEEQK
jgi:hypothetical protein